MKALILAAGRGSRMNQMTDSRPKCLIKINGQSLLSRQIDALQKGGVTEIGIVTGYRREMLAGFGDREFYNGNWSTTNMVSSLTTASAWVHESPCIISYSDIFYSENAVNQLVTSNETLTVVYDPNWRTLWEERFGDPLIDAETFRIAPSGDIAEIGKNPSNVEEIQGQFVGLLKFTPQAWAELEKIRKEISPKYRDTLDMTSALQHIIDRQNVRVKGIAISGDWGEVDRPQDLNVYQKKHKC